MENFIYKLPQLYTMDETVSVRIPKKELKEIEKILKYQKSTKSAMLRELLEIGIKNKMLEIAIEKFQKNEATAERAANIARVPLSLFFHILNKRGIELHYDLEEFRKDVEDLI